MKERTILFSAPMVRTILDGTKTQSRRVVKLQPRTRADVGHHGGGMPFIRNPDSLRSNLPCPYGQPGDRLWVRECFAAWWDTATGKRSKLMGYRADIDDPDWDGGFADDPWWLDAKWEPSIHMPRAFSRITLEVTGVRVERLQDISEADAIAEGINPAPGALGDDDIMVHQVQTAHGADWSKPLMPTPCARYVLLWDSINGKYPNNWNANPFVWVVEFKRVTP